MNQKIDWRKDYKELYLPKVGVVSEVKVPKMNFLMIDGKGDPNTSKEMPLAFGALYPVSYTLKFSIKNTGGPEYAVFPSEGLWWADDMNVFGDPKADKSTWKWTIMIRQPDFITKKEVLDAIKIVKDKNKVPNIEKLRFEEYSEGKAVQMMHIGPYSEEGPNILKLHDYIKGKGWKLSGLHHEIYISDPSRAKPEKMKTVIRQPYKT